MFSVDIDCVVELVDLCVLANLRIFSTDGFCNLKVSLLVEVFFVVLANSLVVFVKLFMLSLVCRLGRLLEKGEAILLAD